MNCCLQRFSKFVNKNPQGNQHFTQCIMSLRHYQFDAINQIRGLFSGGCFRVLLHLATGGGKTHIFSYILKQTQFDAIMVVRGRKLVDQASQRLIREKVPHGVLMANHWLRRPGERIQVCSIDTLVSRKLKPKAKLIVIDEAHTATSDGFLEFLKQYPGAYVLGVTATPYSDRPLKQIFEHVVHPISIRGLIQEGFLVPPKYFCPPGADTSAVKVSRATKDFVTADLEKACDTNALVGDLVSHWRELANGRPTICFAVSIKHSRHIVDSFNAAGIPAEHIEAETPDRERSAVLARLQSGETKIVSNVGILCTGVDMPHVSCILQARPTKSYILYIQQLGRGTRSFSGKENFLVLDHADNVRRHGFIEDEQPADLEGKGARGICDVKICAECYAAFKGRQCPSCDCVVESEIYHRVIEVIPGKLTELSDVPPPKDLTDALEYHAYLIEKSNRFGYKPGWVFFQMKERFGDAVANQVCNKKRIPAWLRR